jgi:hypothetical protein
VAGLLASWRLRAPVSSAPAPSVSQGPQGAGPAESSHPAAAAMADTGPAATLQALPAAVVTLTPAPSAAPAASAAARPVAKAHGDAAGPTWPVHSPQAPVASSASPPPAASPPPRRPDSKDGNALFGLEPK